MRNPENPLIPGPPSGGGGNLGGGLALGAAAAVTASKLPHARHEVMGILEDGVTAFFRMLRDWRSTNGPKK